MFVVGGGQFTFHVIRVPLQGSRTNNARKAERARLGTMSLCEIHQPNQSSAN